MTPKTMRMLMLTPLLLIFGCDDPELRTGTTDGADQQVPPADGLAAGDAGGGLRCGDGAVNGEEQCDGTALGGATCESLGFAGGSLDCKPDCTLDTSQCPGAGFGAT